MGLNIGQRQVAIAMFFAAIFSFIYIGIAYYWLPIDVAPSIDPQSRLQYVIRCDLFAILMLLLGIACVAKQRFFSPTAIGGDTLEADRSIVINIRYIQNTLEQCVLLFITHLALATIVPAETMKLIPILVSLFVIGRLLFWIGYHHSALSRAFGFATTFYPTAVCLIYSCFEIIHRN